MALEDVTVEVSADGHLTIAAERRRRAGAKTGQRERPFGRVARRLRLPPRARVEGNAVSASLRAGVLEVSVPKEAEGAGAPARVEVEVKEDAGPAAGA